MEKIKRFEGMQRREIECESIDLRIINDDERTIELSFSSETPIERYGAIEILSHTRNAVMLDRLNKTGCLLYNHNRDKVIGKIIKAEIRNKRGVAKVQFDDDADSLVYYNKVKSGTLRNTSVGYIVHKYSQKTDRNGGNEKVTYIADLWEPIEISIVSIPADISVGIGRAMDIGMKVKLAEYQLQINQNYLKY